MLGSSRGLLGSPNSDPLPKKRSAVKCRNVSAFDRLPESLSRQSTSGKSRSIINCRNVSLNNQLPESLCFRSAARKSCFPHDMSDDAESLAPSVLDLRRPFCQRRLDGEDELMPDGVNVAHICWMRDEQWEGGERKKMRVKRRIDMQWRQCNPYSLNGGRQWGRG